MSLINKSYNLKNVRFTLRSGVILDATEVSIKRKIEVKDRSAGLTLAQQQVINKEMMPEISVKGWNSDNLSFADLKPGTSISALTILSTESGTPSVLPDDFFTRWPVSGMSLGDTETGFNEADPSTWTTAILCGILNPNALA